MTDVQWRRREPPLAAAAAMGRADVAVDLATRIADGVDPSLLRAVAAPGWLVVLGETDALPWADGVEFLGWEHGLLLPTTRTPVVPLELVSRKLLRRYRAELTVLVPGAVLTAPMPSAPVDLARLLELL